MAFKKMNSELKKKRYKEKMNSTCGNNGSNGAYKTINFRGFGAMISRHTKPRSSFVIGIKKGYSRLPPL
jgi:SPX domain protein involved in polyphosphate accumulation